MATEWLPSDSGVSKSFAVSSTRRDFNDKLLDSQSIRKMDPNPKPDPQDHGKPAGEGGGNSKSSDDAPIIDEDATFRNAAYFGNEEGSKDKDGGSQKK
ncbi:hypothetical protein HYQ45_012835 [Verticillium longisporum]|uniref:Uncharacterized protein n=1 Tax=Verticillium longisporum TaxID=100787 RepID=A0A8I3AK02_VERLO|nr:hypothetical protein HYQ45_012835 [Verticillium longisporum]